MSTVSSDSVARLCVRVSANQQPHVLRHCPRCGTERDFASSGKFRVNAHRKMIDVWLIFLCTTCDYRWNLPVHERRPVKAIDPVELEALMRNDTALADHYAAANTASSDVAITLAFVAPMHPETQAIEMTIGVAQPCSIRLDRLLARVLGLRRREIDSLFVEAMLLITPESGKALRRPAIDGQKVQIDLAGASENLAKRCRMGLAEVPLNNPASDPPD